MDFDEQEINSQRGYLYGKPTAIVQKYNNEFKKALALFTKEKPLYYYLLLKHSLMMFDNKISCYDFINICKKERARHKKPENYIAAIKPHKKKYVLYTVLVEKCDFTAVPKIWVRQCNAAIKRELYWFSLKRRSSNHIMLLGATSPQKRGLWKIALMNSHCLESYKDAAVAKFLRSEGYNEQLSWWGACCWSGDLNPIELRNMMRQTHGNPRNKRRELKEEDLPPAYDYNPDSFYNKQDEFEVYQDDNGNNKGPPPLQYQKSMENVLAQDIASKHDTYTSDDDLKQNSTKREFLESATGDFLEF